MGLKISIFENIESIVPNLSEFDVKSNSLTDSQLKCISRLKKLRTLCLEQRFGGKSSISLKGINHLIENCNKLEKIQFNGEIKSLNVKSINQLKSNEKVCVVFNQ